jgi:hypothetical protein
MHASTASFLEGGIARVPCLKPPEYSLFAASILFSSAMTFYLLSLERKEEYN